MTRASTAAATAIAPGTSPASERAPGWAPAHAGAGDLHASELSDRDFARVRALLSAQAGISLGPEKKALVVSRLDKRLRALGGCRFAAYLDLIEKPEHAAERQVAVDLLTTNETYFFREPDHFVRLRQWIDAGDMPARRWRAWSAAASTGQEAYSLAMVFADAVGAERFEVLGTDVSTRVLARAASGHYPAERTEHIPPAYMKRYLLKGIGRQAGTLLVERALRERTSFYHANVLQPQADLGAFDVIFLRNVLIYFDADTKRQAIARVSAQLRRNGLFVVSHAESIYGLADGFEPVAPAMYRKL